LAFAMYVMFMYKKFHALTFLHSHLPGHSEPGFLCLY
jgi:hypothetical protein